LGANDTIQTGNGNNTIFGGSGSDDITFGNGNNIVFGDNGQVQYQASASWAVPRRRTPPSAATM